MLSSFEIDRVWGIPGMFVTVVKEGWSELSFFLFLSCFLSLILSFSLFPVSKGEFKVDWILSVLSSLVEVFPWRQNEQIDSISFFVFTFLCSVSCSRCCEGIKLLNTETKKALQPFSRTSHSVLSFRVPIAFILSLSLLGFIFTLLSPWFPPFPSNIDTHKTKTTPPRLWPQRDLLQREGEGRRGQIGIPILPFPFSL